MERIQEIDKIEKVNLREVEFITHLVMLMHAHPDFSDIVQEPLLPGLGRRLRPDIICKYKGTWLIVECKGLAPLIRPWINDIVVQIDRYASALPGAKLVLAIPIQLQPAYKDILLRESIDVWDLDYLSIFFQDQLEIIKETTLYNLIRKDRKTPSPSDQLIQRLRQIPRGRNEWSTYQRLIADIFEFLFTPSLSKPIYEMADTAGVNRRDIIVPNYSEHGFWAFLRNKYMADYIVIDAKNYTHKVKKAAVLQIANYLLQFAVACDLKDSRLEAGCARLWS